MKKSKTRWFNSGNCFFGTTFVQLAVAVKRCTSKKECNKLDLTAPQFFWLVDHNDWSRWFAIGSSYVYAVPATVLLVGLAKIKVKLRHLILLSRVIYWWICSTYPPTLAISTLIILFSKMLKILKLINYLTNMFQR